MEFIMRLRNTRMCRDNWQALLNIVMLSEYDVICPGYYYGSQE